MNTLPQQSRSQYEIQKDEPSCKPKNTGKLIENTTCIKKNSGSFVF